MRGLKWELSQGLMFLKRCIDSANFFSSKPVGLQKHSAYKTRTTTLKTKQTFHPKIKTTNKQKNSTIKSARILCKKNFDQSQKNETGRRTRISVLVFECRVQPFLSLFINNKINSIILSKPWCPFLTLEPVQTFLYVSNLQIVCVQTKYWTWKK